MSHEPASANPFASLSLAQLIRLNLTRLYTWLVQMNAAGQTSARPDYAQMVNKTDALVHAYIRSRAMVQLEAAGFFDAARAMRLPASMRASPLDTPRLAVEPAELEPVTPAELLSRVEAMIDQFEQAESIASTLARIIVCALLYISPRTQNVTVRGGIITRQTIRYRRVGVRPPKRTSLAGQGPPDPWPPPDFQAKLYFAVGRRCTAKLFAEIPSTKCNKIRRVSRFALNSAPQNNSTRPRAPSAAINVHLVKKSLAPLGERDLG